VLLTAMQLVVGWIAHSQSLIADAMHTLSDIVADGFVLYANNKSAEAADESHPYGHGRIETAASLLLGALLASTGAGILISAVGRLQNLDNLPAVGVAAMWAALATLAGKEGLFRYMLKVAERLRSPMLVANAWHARADALSSLVVAAGIGGALAGFPFADAAAAIVVGAMIVKAGVQFAWDALRELVDTGLSADEVARIRESIEAVPGVVGLHELRTRRMGHKALVDAHIQVNPRISVSEGHLIAETARIRTLSAHPDILDVLVHVDAENDLDPATWPGKLPDRQMLIEHLRSLLGEDDLPDLEDTVFHYLGRQVEADVFLNTTILADPERAGRLRARLTKALADDPWFRSISLNCKIAPY
jgi:cation diffusion facilitator family transporter